MHLKLYWANYYLFGGTLIVVVAIVFFTVQHRPDKALIRYDPLRGFVLEGEGRLKSNFEGPGLDITLPSSIAIDGTGFHPGLYYYRFENIEIESSLSGSSPLIRVLGLRGDVVWLDSSTDIELGRAELSGMGHQLGKWATISYIGEQKSNTGSDIWSGNFVLEMPPSGSLHGYFLTMHADDDLATPRVEVGGKFALGSLLWNRKLEIDVN